jgi:hypothetical protein
MKVLSKKVIVQKKEVAHTLGERNILVGTFKKKGDLRKTAPSSTSQS